MPASDPALIPDDLRFIILLFVLFVVPRALQRFRIPAAVTALVMGAVAYNAGWASPNVTLQLLSTFGIVSLFLFAGLEINGSELRRDARTLAQHGITWSLLTGLTAFAAVHWLGLGVRPAVLIALALMTPSTGFILSTLGTFGLDTDERFAVKSKAVGSELLALAGLFFVVQSSSVERFVLALAALVTIVIVIPLALRIFARLVAPYAPKSEFAFLLMIAVVCAYATRRLGVYYLLGAFVVGVAAQRFRTRLPAMSSERMIDALEAFGSVFIPFYFFRAGTHIDRQQLSWEAVLIGAALMIVFIPLRVGATMLQRRVLLREPWERSRRIGVALVPTLVFTLVITEILRSYIEVSEALLGGLILYTVLNTLLPAFMLRTPVPAFEAVQATPLALAQQQRLSMGDLGSRPPS